MLFDIRPVVAVAGLVPGGQHCGPVLQALPGLGNIARLLVRNRGHAVYYFGIGHVESLTGP
jgi:hypothetical protein